MTYIKYTDYLKLENKENYQPVLTQNELLTLRTNKQMPRFSITASNSTVKELNEMDDECQM